MQKQTNKKQTKKKQQKNKQKNKTKNKKKRPFLYMPVYFVLYLINKTQDDSNTMYWSISENYSLKLTTNEIHNIACFSDTATSFMHFDWPTVNILIFLFSLFIIFFFFFFFEGGVSSQVPFLSSLYDSLQRRRRTSLFVSVLLDPRCFIRWFLQDSSPPCIIVKVCRAKVFSS